MPGMARPDPAGFRGRKSVGLVLSCLEIIRVCKKMYNLLLLVPQDDLADLVSGGVLFPVFGNSNKIFKKKDNPLNE